MPISSRSTLSFETVFYFIVFLPVQDQYYYFLQLCPASIHIFLNCGIHPFYRFFELLVCLSFLASSLQDPLDLFYCLVILLSYNSILILFYLITLTYKYEIILNIYIYREREREREGERHTHITYILNLSCKDKFYIKNEIKLKHSRRVRTERRPF